MAGGILKRITRFNVKTELFLQIRQKRQIKTHCAGDKDFFNRIKSHRVIIVGDCPLELTQEPVYCRSNKIEYLFGIKS